MEFFSLSPFVLFCFSQRSFGIWGWARECFLLAQRGLDVIFFIDSRKKGLLLAASFLVLPMETLACFPLFSGS